MRRKLSLDSTRKLNFDLLPTAARSEPSTSSTSLPMIDFRISVTYHMIIDI